MITMLHLVLGVVDLVVVVSSLVVVDVLLHLFFQVGRHGGGSEWFGWVGNKWESQSLGFVGYEASTGCQGSAGASGKW